MFQNKNTPKHFRLSLRVAALALALLAFGGAGTLRQPASAFGSGLAANDAGLQVSAAPAVISANGRLTLSVKSADGTPYSGALDYDMLFCATGKIDAAACAATHGAWGDYVIDSGSISIDVESAGGGVPFVDGTYIARYRPRGSSARYSNQAAYVIDRAARPVAESDAKNSGAYIVPKPVAGAYTIFRDAAPDGTVNGYSKVEYEHDACEGGGVIQRFTKTSPIAYWGPESSASDTNIKTLRWCVGSSQTNPSNFKAFSSAVYVYNRTNVKSSSLSSTSYLNTQLGNLSRLGGDQPAAAVQARLSTLPQLQSPSEQPGAGGQAEKVLTPLGATPLFYTLAPVNLFPETLTTTFVPIIDRLIDYDPVREVLNTWHVEVRASSLGGIYEVRYVEWALAIANLTASTSRASTPSGSVADWNVYYRWNVLEDWDWNADGTLNRITQQGNTHAFTQVQPGDFQVDCWTRPQGCEHAPEHRLDKVLSYTPDNRPLVVQFVDNFGSRTSLLTTRANQPFRLSVQTADGQPFDGFLQLAPSAGAAPAWVDAKSYPIYVSNGYVELLPSALGNQPSGVTSFQARQQLLSENIASDIVLAAPEPPTNTAQPFSNEIYLLKADS